MNSTIRDMINKDIEKCNELIEKGYATYDDELCFTAKYKKIDKNFGSELHNYVRTIGDNINYIKNIKIIKSELEALLLLKGSTEKEEIVSNNRESDFNYFPPNMTFNFNNDNSSNNSNVNNFNISFSDLIKKINNDTDIADTDKKDIILKLQELEEVSKVKESKEKKYSKIKSILQFFLDKGVDFVIAYLPQIIFAIKQLGGF